MTRDAQNPDQYEPHSLAVAVWENVTPWQSMPCTSVLRASAHSPSPFYVKFVLTRLTVTVLSGSLSEHEVIGNTANSPHIKIKFLTVSFIFLIL